MSTRKITIFDSQTGTKEVLESAAATWGELKNKLRSNVSEKTCVLSKSKMNIELDSAVLPEEEFTVFVYPKESKGGMATKPKKRAAKKAAKKKVVKKAAKKPVKKAKIKAKPAKKKVSKPVRKAIAKVVTSLTQPVADIEAENRSLQNEARQIARELKNR